MDRMSEQSDVVRLALSGEPKPSGCERGEVSPQERDTYLEIIRNVVDGSLNRYETEYYIQACGCKSWFCSRCCLGLGLKRCEELIKVLESFESCQMWTLTIDPMLFNSPSEAFQYTRKKRSISELVRALKKSQVLISKRYFYVLECQKQTEMPHWHLLLESKHIPFDLVPSMVKHIVFTNYSETYHHGIQFTVRMFHFSSVTRPFSLLN